MCDHYLERVNCPSHLRQITACTYGDGVLSTVSECTCGGNDVPGGRIQELITDVSLFRRYDLVDVAGYITLDAVNLCSTFTSTCDKMLEHINCPADEKVSIGCDDVLDYDTWQGVCTCGDYDTSDRVTEDIYDSLMRSNFQTLVVEFNQTNHNNIDRNTSYEFSSPDKQWDMCASYKAICNSFLDKIACPTALQQISTCGNISTAYPYGQIQYYNGSCVCGGMDTLNDRNFEVVIDALLFESINKHYLYLPPPQATYSLMAGHNPFKQLLYQENKNHVVPQ